jgi:hypothetical protein
MIDSTAPRFGLPASLWIPIAAANVATIETYVGRVLQSKTDPKNGRPNALLVKSRAGGVVKEPDVPLWKSALAASADERLYPERQVWVYVDYDDYRQAYIQFGMPPIPANYFLDHVQNRIAIRKRAYSHPYLRLCPVDRRVNTSGGHSAGGEGHEKRFLDQYGAPKGNNKIIYADPMDLTKMLDIPPGTEVLNGVRDTQGLFYP